MVIGTGVTGSFPSNGPFHSAHLDASSDFSKALIRATLIEAINEPPEGPDRTREGASPRPQPTAANAGAVEPSAEGAGRLPPIGRPPPVAAAPEPDEVGRITALLAKIRSAPLHGRSGSELNEYATALAAVHRSTAPAWLKQVCRVTLQEVTRAGGHARPPPSMIAYVAARPSLGPRAGVTLASLLTWMPQAELEALPAGQRDALFAKLDSLNEDPRTRHRLSFEDSLQISAAGGALLRAGASIVVQEPLSFYNEANFRQATPAATAKALAAMTDQAVGNLKLKDIVYDTLSRKAGLTTEVAAACQVQADRLLALSSLSTGMQQSVDMALEDFPHSGQSLRVVFDRPIPQFSGDTEAAPLMFACTGDVPVDIQTRLNSSGSAFRIDITVARMAMMDDYMIDLSRCEITPLIRLPDEEAFTAVMMEAAIVVPPGTEIQFGSPFDTYFCRFTLPPMH